MWGVYLEGSVSFGERGEVVSRGMKMKRVRKIVLAVVLILGIGALLSGCSKRYTDEDRIEYAQKLLFNKYGERFKITEVFGTDNRWGWFDVYAYSVNHPDVIFRGHYGMDENDEYTESENDYYIEELVAEQYKDLAEEELKDFAYDYYLDSRLRGRQEREIPLTDSTITIEEFNAITEDKHKDAHFYLYITDEALKESDEYLYDTLKSVAECIEYATGVFFFTKKDLEMIKDEYKIHSVLNGSTQTYIDSNYSWISEWKYGDHKHGYIMFQAPAYDGIITFEFFQEQMAVIRADAGY